MWAKRSCGAFELDSLLALDVNTSAWAWGWDAIAAISALVLALGVGATAYFAIRQLRETAGARQAEILAKVHDILGAPEVEKARETVKHLPPGFDIDKLDAEKRKAIELVTRSFDRVGFYLWCKLIKEEYVLPEYPGALWHWERLKHYVENQREVERYEARRFFEYMADRTRKFRQKHGLPVGDNRGI